MQASCPFSAELGRLLRRGECSRFLCVRRLSRCGRRTPRAETMIQDAQGRIVMAGERDANIPSSCTRWPTARSIHVRERRDGDRARLLRLSRSVVDPRSRSTGRGRRRRVSRAAAAVRPRPRGDRRGRAPRRQRRARPVLRRRPSGAASRTTSRPSASATRNLRVHDLAPHVRGAARPLARLAAGGPDLHGSLQRGRDADLEPSALRCAYLSLALAASRAPAARRAG